jgi:predicted DsbA family dithiol-disulfide isomerase
MQVEIWSDVVCPWCYIGKRRFESALADFKHRAQIEVVWKSFELDPKAPRTSEDTLNQILAKKYGMSVEKAAAANERVTSHGLQGEMKERLMHAYFTEGQPVSDTETLVKLGVEVGLDIDEARAVLASAEYADEVKADEQEARTLGISGVPFFVIDQKYGISGAQPTELFQQTLAQVWTESHPLIQVSSASSAEVGNCEGDSCEI